MDCGSFFMVWRNFVKQKNTEILHVGLVLGALSSRFVFGLTRFGCGCPFPCNNLVQALFCFQTASMIFQWPLIGTFAKTNGLRSRSNGRPAAVPSLQSPVQPFHHKIGAPSKIAPKNSTTRHPAPTSKLWYSEYELGVNRENSYLGKYPMMAANQSHWFAICWFDHIFFKYLITFLQ